MRARIVQCLCPSRHAIIAMAIDTNPEVSDGELLASIKTIVSALLAGRGLELRIGLPIDRIDPWCNVCRAPARAWGYEVAWTKEFTDWESAKAVLLELEAANIVSGAIAAMIEKHRRN